MTDESAGTLPVAVIKAYDVLLMAHEPDVRASNSPCLQLVSPQRAPLQ